MLNVCIVAGARPNFIKVAPIVRSINKAHDEGKQICYELVYAGSEDDITLESSLFDDLQIERP
jgi:UDP-N-acetylglucosamine 2-epimerase (non-hydrolysing)